MVGRWRKTPFSRIGSTNFTPVFAGLFGLKFADKRLSLWDSTLAECCRLRSMPGGTVALDWNAPLFRGIARLKRLPTYLRRRSTKPFLIWSAACAAVSHLRVGYSPDFPNCQAREAGGSHPGAASGCRTRSGRDEIHADQFGGGTRGERRAEEEAERICRSTLEAAPHYVWMFNALASALDRQGRRVEAIEAVRQAKALQPDNRHWDAARLARFGAA